ncbi:GIY-YIG nuclease family protein [Streptosporangium sandarakinum]|uniref:GIY-YIG nuclease family protein n=1 Tax=Streptosporangium sandarakinum TaxID=1260955 RepID=UPI003716ED00
MSNTLLPLRRSMKGADATAENRAVAELIYCGIQGTLERFILGMPERKPDCGFLYILSTRDKPTFLKIGYADRDVRTRVREINSATGVIVPYGAREIWIFPRARNVEANVHALLTEFRVRKDREFFEVKFSDAAKVIDEYLATLAP